VLNIKFNDERCRELYRELGLKKPVQIRVYNRTRKGAKPGEFITGEALNERRSWTYDTTHQLVIEGGELERFEGLKLKREVIVTFLHEARHLHQNDHWDPARKLIEASIDYRARPSEKDAEGWALANWRRYSDILTVKRNTTNSRFGKLSQAAERAKQ
jgi:hypothetical protein